MLQLRFLGTPDINLAGQPIAGALSNKAQAILTYLAMTGQPQTRAVLATLLWGDLPEAVARTNLRKALVRLRRELDPYLQIERHVVAFKPEIELWVDAVEFEAGVKAGSTPIDVDRLQAAIELYQGDFLTGFYVLNAPDFEAWMLLEQARLRELVIEALHTLGTHFAEGGNVSRGIATVRRLLKLEPWREEAHRQLMFLLAHDGQRGAALAQFETCRQVLAEELSVDPAKETVALYERIRDDQLSQTVETQYGTNIGKQAGTGDILPAAPHPAQPIHTLPVHPTSFVGREKELADVIRRLTDRDCRLLTLIGPGGIGKTRLALQTAQTFIETGSAKDFFPHGLIFASLVGVGSDSALVPAIAEAANFSFYNSLPPRQQLLDYLQEKRLLLILDNLEHVLASGTDLIADVLAVAPAVKILVTSREALNLQEAWFHPVPGMPFPNPDPQSVMVNRVDPQGTSLPLERYDAVRLFVQSAGRARVDFSLAVEQAHVVRICQLVEGMPLAIELAAAWLKVLPVEKIAHEIERNIDFLTSRQQDVPERHYSIRAVFEHSWQLLTAEEQNVLKRLSVFRGSFTEEAAGRVAAASLPTLAGLVEKSLLRVTESARYILHELLRQFAAAKLAEDDPTALDARERHSAYYLGFLKARETRLTGPAQQTALTEIGEEIDNIRLAWLWAVDQNDLAAIQQTMAAYFNFFLIRSRLQEGEETFAHLLDQLQQAPERREDPQNDGVRARALIRRGAFCYFLGDYERANRYVEAGLQTELDQAYQRDVVFGHLVLGVVAGWQDKKDQAEAQLLQSLAISQDIDDKEHMADALHELAFIRSRDDYAEGKRLARESLALSRAQGRPDWVAHALERLGWITSCLGEYVEAETCYREALAIFETVGSRYGTANALCGLGWVAWSKGKEQLATAREYCEQSLIIGREIGHRLLIANLLGDLALIANELRDYTASEAYSHQGLRLANEIGSSIYRAYNLCCLGGAACGRGDYADSRRYLAEALLTAMAPPISQQLTFALFNFAILLVKESDATGSQASPNRDMKIRALELLALVIHHPTTWQGIKDRAARLQAQLEAELPPDVVTTAKVQGQSKTLEDVVTELLQHEKI